MRKIHEKSCKRPSFFVTLQAVCKNFVDLKTKHNNEDYPYTATDICSVALINAYRKLHYIYSSQLRTPFAELEPSFETSCKACYDPNPYYNPDAIAIHVSVEPEESPEFRPTQEDISDYNYPEEIPGLSLRDSRMRRFHDCLDSAIEKHRDIREDDLFATAVLEQLA